MWLGLVPSPGGPGDLAVTDSFFDPPVSPMVTAFVKANRADAAEDAKIKLIVFDMDTPSPPQPDIHVDLAAPYPIPGTNDYFCRHPAVQVTYFHAPQTPLGYIGIHVVWSQWVGTLQDGSWELFYKFIRVFVDQSGIQWNLLNTDEFPVFPLSPGGTPLDEIQPDLAVDAENSSMFVIFLQTLEPDNPFYNIFVQQGVIFPDMPLHWNLGLYFIPSGPPEVEKSFPKIDVGWINTDPGQPSLKRNTAFAVWSEWDLLLENYQVWYAMADPLNPGSIITNRLTDSENGTEPGHEFKNCNILPSVDIPAPSSASGIYANMQAVICYEGMDLLPNGMVLEQRVYCRITPDLTTEFLLRGDDDHYWIMDAVEARVPEVACYQMNNLGATEQWFGVAMQASVGMCIPPDLETYTGSWSYQVSEGGIVSLSDQLHEWSTVAYHQDPFWSLEHPATGPTICLRGFAVGEPIANQRFGLGWINGMPGAQPDEVWLGEGTIY